MQWYDSGSRPMSKLQLLHRPWVVFDPHNEKHRSYYSEFVRYATWGRCPVRFFTDDDSGDLITMIQRKLVDYYVTNEFPDSQKRLTGSSK